MVGLQLMHSGPLIPSNVTHNVTSFPQRGVYPSHSINYSFHLLSLSSPVTRQKLSLGNVAETGEKHFPPF